MCTVRPSLVSIILPIVHYYGPSLESKALYLFQSMDLTHWYVRHIILIYFDWGYTPLSPHFRLSFLIFVSCVIPCIADNALFCSTCSQCRRPTPRDISLIEVMLFSGPSAQGPPVPHLQSLGALLLSRMNLFSSSSLRGIIAPRCPLYYSPSFPLAQANPTHPRPVLGRRFHRSLLLRLARIRFALSQYRQDHKDRVKPNEHTLHSFPGISSIRRFNDWEILFPHSTFYASATKHRHTQFHGSTGAIPPGTIDDMLCALHSTKLNSLEFTCIAYPGGGPPLDWWVSIVSKIIVSDGQGHPTPTPVVISTSSGPSTQVAYLHTLTHLIAPPFSWFSYLAKNDPPPGADIRRDLFVHKDPILHYCYLQLLSPEALARSALLCSPGSPSLGLIQLANATRALSEAKDESAYDTTTHQVNHLVFTHVVLPALRDIALTGTPLSLLAYRVLFDHLPGFIHSGLSTYTPVQTSSDPSVCHPLLKFEPLGASRVGPIVYSFIIGFLSPSPITVIVWLFVDISLSVYIRNYVADSSTHYFLLMFVSCVTFVEPLSGLRLDILPSCSQIWRSFCLFQLCLHLIDHA